VKGIDSSARCFVRLPAGRLPGGDGRLGVALGRNALVAPDLKAGRLVVPFEFKMSAEAAYYLVYPPEAIRRARSRPSATGSSRSPRCSSNSARA